MNKNESKYYNSAKKMHEALIVLLDEKDFEMLTIKEICDRAGVNRSTFYLHYDNVNDLLAETMEAVYRNFFEQFGTMQEEELHIGTKTEDELFFIKSEYLVPYLKFVKNNRRLFRLLNDKHDVIGSEKIYLKWFQEIFGPILTKFRVSEVQQPFIMTFYLNGLIGVVTMWVQTDCEMSMEELITVIQKCIMKP